MSSGLQQSATPPRPWFTLRQIYAAPAAIGLLTGAGLICALLGDGVWDALGCAALAIPIAVEGSFAASSLVLLRHKLDG